MRPPPLQDGVVGRHLPKERLMAGSSAGLHESEEEMSVATIEDHRAIVSIIEELEAVDWYRQRADATKDPELAAILVHNRDEEKEHAVMALEWLRRRDPVLDAHMRTYLFTEGSIVELEHVAEATGNAGDDRSGSLGIGSLRGEELS
jgi:ferritin-like protein